MWAWYQVDFNNFVSSSVRSQGVLCFVIERGSNQECRVVRARNAGHPPGRLVRTDEIKQKAVSPNPVRARFVTINRETIRK